MNPCQHTSTLKFNLHLKTKELQLQDLTDNLKHQNKKTKKLAYERKNAGQLLKSFQEFIDHLKKSMRNQDSYYTWSLKIAGLQKLLSKFDDQSGKLIEKLNSNLKSLVTAFHHIIQNSARSSNQLAPKEINIISGQIVNLNSKITTCEFELSELADYVQVLIYKQNEIFSLFKKIAIFICKEILLTINLKNVIDYDYFSSREFLLNIYSAILSM